MTGIDWVIAAVVVLSMLTGLKRGLIAEAVSLAKWLAAFIIAKVFSGPLALLLAPHVSPPSLRVPAAFTSLFVATLVVGGLMGRLLEALVQATGLTGTDRLLGLMFGGIRGVFIWVIVLGVLSRTTSMSDDPWWKESQLIPPLMECDVWVNTAYAWVSDWVIRLAS